MSDLTSSGIYFQADPELQQVATRSADFCVKFIQHKFGKNADYSEAFVPEIENILHLLHLSMPASKPSEDDIEQFCSMFGSYLGETYRRNRGGAWGVSDGRTPTLSFGGGFKSFPSARVYKRLINGEEDNVHHWYLGMIQYGSGGASTQNTPPSTPPPLPQSPSTAPKEKGFFSKLFGGR